MCWHYCWESAGCADLASWKCWFLLPAFYFLPWTWQHEFKWYLVTPCFTFLLSSYYNAVTPQFLLDHLLLQRALAHSAEHILRFLRTGFAWLGYRYQVVLTGVSTGCALMLNWKDLLLSTCPKPCTLAKFPLGFPRLVVTDVLCLPVFAVQIVFSNSMCFPISFYKP